MTTRQAIIDPRQEAALLDRYGFRYVDRKVKLADIDFERSKQLNGRSETRANPDTIEEYAYKKLDGEVFPYPVVALDRSTNKFLIWSGVHRIGADFLIEALDTRCFVVEVPVAEATKVLAKLKQFSHETNVRHGFATSIAERIHAACDEYEQGGKLEEIAHRFSLRPEDITKGLQERRLNFDLRQHGIRPETILRTSDKEAILRLPDEHIMKDVARFIVRHTIQDGRATKPTYRVTQGEVNALVTALRKEKVPAERLKLIEAADALALKGKKQAPRGHKNINDNPLFIWRMVVNRVTKGFDERTLVSTASTGDEMDTLMGDVKSMRSVLDSIEHLIEQKR